MALNQGAFLLNKRKKNKTVYMLLAEKDFAGSFDLITLPHHSPYEYC